MNATAPDPRGAEIGERANRIRAVARAWDQPSACAAHRAKVPARARRVLITRPPHR
jgi:hypothetical protein